MIHLFQRDRLPVSRWRNGGGETREIASYPPGAADFDWRLSIATIATDGDFSAFPDIDRIITLLSGEVDLYREGQLAQRLIVNQPYRFRGEESISARLHAGISHDFNLMARRGRVVADAGTTAAAFTPPQDAAGMMLVLRGRWQQARTSFVPDQGAWWEERGGEFTPQSDDALLLWGTLIPDVNRGL